MTAHLTRLRIAGFKSFAEPVSLDILPGLTGIVGPNGCGKSNVVEALRWAMGETSARSLRGGEMDDVIFAGTTARASRNLAEVTITLNGALPAPYEAEAELQVTRRIERGAGSAFRANGRELRARDVQTLYADLASGARSSGMVSQGRVATLVNARPEERRQVLEEAAGITGLHARRHEAELKLRAAEQNLSRAEDLRGQMEGAQEAMRKQARQAARYRNISGLVRAAEAEHLAVLLAGARAQAAETEAAHQAAQAEAHAATEWAAQATALLEAAEAAVPVPRAALAEAARGLERRRVAAEGLAEEAARAARAAGEAEQRLLELEADLAAAERARADTGASVTRLQAETLRLGAVLAALPARIAEANTAARAASEGARTAQDAADLAAEQAMAAALATSRAKADRDAAQERLGLADTQHKTAEAAHAEALAALVPTEEVTAAQAACASAEMAVLSARRAFAAAETARAQAASSHAQHQAQADQVRAAHRAADQALREAASRHRRLSDSLAGAQAALAALLAARIGEDRITQLRDAVDAAQEELSAAEQHTEAGELEAADCLRLADQAARAASEGQAQAARAAGGLAEAEARARRLNEEHEAARSAIEETERGRPAAGVLAEAESRLAAAGQALAGSAADTVSAAALERQTGTELAAARQARDGASAEAARLAGIAAGLEEAVQGGEGAGPAVLAGLSVPDGLDAALGAALGEGCAASLDPDATRFWRELQPAAPHPVLPAGSVPLGGLVAAPAALARVLAHVALLDEGMDGDSLQASLAPGVVAVTRQGACWRWDGQVIRADAPNPAALRLTQLRRCSQARAACDAARAAQAAAAAQLDEAAEAATEAAHAAMAARARREQDETVLRAAQEHHQLLARQKELAEARLAAMVPALQRLAAELGHTQAAATEARQLQAALADGVALTHAAQEAAAAAQSATMALQRARESRQTARAALVAAQDAAGRQARQAAETEARINASSPALEDLAAEAEAAESRLAEAGAALRSLPDPAGMETALAAAGRTAADAHTDEAACRAARDDAEHAAGEARAVEAALQARRSQAESQRSLAAGLLDRAAADLAHCAHDAGLAGAALAALPDEAALAEAAGLARAVHDAARRAALDAAAQADQLRAGDAQARVALQSAQADLLAWETRHSEADARAGVLVERDRMARAAWHALAAAPAETLARSERSVAALAETEAAHEAAAACLARAELALRQAAMAQRDGEQLAAARREAALRAGSALAAAAAGVQAVLERAAEKLGPDAALPDGAETGAAAEDRARRRFERLSREREEMGPVNLRAELELAELDARLAALERERGELATAIARLRGAIGHLNREGRARLTAVFTEVDQHFRSLFTRMMGGGRAQLALTGSDDPLLAGLEIYAEPPGKKLAALSLLSGGEQALTALSLIFAIFRCMPAPVSVLDEVDAPLDDANVERFCTLLDDVVRDTGTRFLVVTHHQLTMSRMDRLFGVTMQERGVSRLLSVDLGSAVAMVEPVMQAAE